jgi:hypothetical protein
MLNNPKTGDHSENLRKLLSRLTNTNFPKIKKCKLQKDSVLDKDMMMENVPKHNICSQENI